MRIGLDLDGVFTNFTASYQRLIVKIAGEDKFLPGDIDNPPVYHWPELRGYSPEVMTKVWDAIKNDETFWLNLAPHEDNLRSLRVLLLELERKHDLYFVTSRPGKTAKRQTKMWLIDHLHYIPQLINAEPTVLISSQKGEVAHALKLDLFIEDNYDNAVDIVKKSPATTTYLLNRSYNRGMDWITDQGLKYTRVNTVGQVFDREIALGRL